MDEDTKAVLSLGGGERRVEGHETSALRVGAALSHGWSRRLSTQTALGLASSGTIFARSWFAQDFSYRLTDSLTATVGGKYSSWAGGDHVTAWSAGAAYYVPGLSASYRYTILDSSRLGRSHTHLASLRIRDPHGLGNTQLWLGAGTSLYDLNPQAADRSGRFKSITVRREQPVAHGMALTAGVSRSWFNAPSGNYRATSLLLGFNFTGTGQRLRRPALSDRPRENP
jgi:YaiO family outer membrane protein